MLYNNPFGSLLRKRREELGLSQRNVATKASVSNFTICRMEAGTSPDFGTLLAIADALDLTVTVTFNKKEVDKGC